MGARAARAREEGAAVRGRRGREGRADGEVRAYVCAMREVASTFELTRDSRSRKCMHAAASTPPPRPRRPCTDAWISTDQRHAVAVPGVDGRGRRRQEQLVHQLQLNLLNLQLEPAA